MRFPHTHDSSVSRNRTRQILVSSTLCTLLAIAAAPGVPVQAAVKRAASTSSVPEAKQVAALRASLTSAGYHNVSSKDLHALLGIIQAPATDAHVKVDALDVLIHLKGMTEYEQEEEISASVNKALMAPDDLKTDPTGLVKAKALSVVDAMLDDSSLLVAIKPLVQDNRPLVRSAATRVFINRYRWTFGTDTLRNIKTPEQLIASSAYQSLPVEDLIPSDASVKPSTPEDIRVSQIWESCRKNRTISDADLAFVLAQSSLPYHHGSLGISPLYQVSQKNLTPAQLNAIGDSFKTVVTRNDRSTDPQGFAKMEFCTYVGMLSMPLASREELVKAVKPLLKDPRHLVQSMAEDAAAFIPRGGD